jgi:hypothetical protein
MTRLLEVFADDSEKHDFYTVAGYLKPAEEWQEFSRKWHAVLKEKPRLGFYRTSDALALSGQFAGWTAEQRDTRLAKLAALIPARNTFGVAAHLSKVNFAEFFTPNFLSDWDNPYYLCATYLIENICLYLGMANKNISRLDFIFDRQGKVGRNFKLVYDAFLKPQSLVLFPFMGNVRHEDKLRHLPLQAADMQASWIRRSKSALDSNTPADCCLEGIEQREFPVTRDFLMRLAAYRKEHAAEIRAYWDRIAPE